MNSSFLFEELKARGITLRIAETGIRVRGTLTPDIAQEIEQNKPALLKLMLMSIPFQDKPQSFWAGLKLQLWRRYGAKLFLNEACQDLLQAWSYANQAVAFYIEKATKSKERQP